MAKPQTRSTRLEARIAPRALAVVKRAAEIQGRSVSDFVVAAAQRAAEQAIKDAEIIDLSLADQKAFANAILHPPRPNAALRRAKAAHKRLIASAR